MDKYLKVWFDEDYSVCIDIQGMTEDELYFAYVLLGKRIADNKLGLS